MPPTFMTGVRRVFELSLGEMLWSRRTIFMVIVLAVPVLFAVVLRIVDAAGVTPLRLNGQRMGSATVFGGMIWIFFLRFIVPVLGVFYGTSMIADEVEDKTITYLFTRPVRRSAVLIGKYLAYVACTTLMVLPAVMIVYFLVVPFGEVPASFRWLMTDLALLAAGLAVYGALFALVGAVMKRPLLVGLIFAFGWEQVAMLVPGYLRRFTVAYYLQALVPHAMPSEGIGALVNAVFSDSPSLLLSLTGLTVVLAGSLYLATMAVERREYILEQ